MDILRRYFQDQHGLVQDDQLKRIGISRTAVATRLRRGDWVRMHPGVFRLAGAGRTSEQALLAACLAAHPMAAASHRSAAWMWGLADRAPERPEITMPHRVTARLSGVLVHTSRDFDPARTLIRRGIPCTDPLRALADLAAVVVGEDLTAAVDRALSSRLVSVGGLVAEIERRSRQGRPGIKAMRALLAERGFTGGPPPSVLEAEAMRFFARWGIEVLHREALIEPDGRYRIDFLLASRLIAEFDGYTFHWSPEAKRYDEERRNRLRLDGYIVLVYTWRDLRFEPRRTASEIVRALTFEPPTDRLEERDLQR